jgi:hypothetical protein
MIRRLAAALAALALLLSLAVPVLAGGWAEIVADAQTTDPPVEDQPVQVGFNVLQHGETPAGWESPTVHFTNVSTGKTIDVAATGAGPDGHFVATATLPEAGFWSWQVTLQDLESQHLPVMLTVATATGQVPEYDPSTTVTAIAQAKLDITQTLGSRFYAEIERVDNLLRIEQAKTDRLVADVNEITGERDALATRLAEADGSGGLPVLGILMLSVLAGASAGFAMAWLAGRPGPSVKVIPSPQGVDPA